MYGLTVTVVVFKSEKRPIFSVKNPSLTVTVVVFKSYACDEGEENLYSLTVTMVVFKYVAHNNMHPSGRFNSNNGCI